MPAAIKGAATMKMMRSTNITSTSGVTLISLIGGASNSLSCLRSAKAIAVSLLRKLAGQFDFEHANETIEALAVIADFGANAIVEDDGGNRREEAEGCCEQGFGNAGATTARLVLLEAAMPW